MYLKESSVLLVSIIFHIQTRKCTKLFTENMTEYFTHAQCVPDLSSGGGGEGPGDKANSDDAISLKLPQLRIMHDKAGCVQT